jgi:hypothetical protein
LNVDKSTISRDIEYLISQSQNYLERLAKETLPFFYETSMEGIREVMKESWNIYYKSDTSDIQKLMALKLIKESHEALFKLLSEGPSVLQIKMLEEKLSNLENRQIH